jgi:hypothetical protein
MVLEESGKKAPLDSEAGQGGLSPCWYPRGRLVSAGKEGRHEASTF